jgi:hypothetical protein
MSTRSKQPRKPAPPKPAPTQRRIGYLSCKTCERTIPYSGTDTSEWPRHRCGLDIKPFTDFSNDEPYRDVLPRRDWRDWPR